MRLIDADEILCQMESVMDMQDVYLPVHFMEMVIEEMPTIEAEPVRRGHIVVRKRVVGGYKHIKCPKYQGSELCGGKITVKDQAEVEEHLCSECKAVLAYSFENYCPNCGAKMEEKKND